MVIGVAGVFFGVLIGWIIGSQQAGGPQPAAAPAATRTAPAPQTAQFDEARADTLRDAATRDPRDGRSRVELGNMYFDADRFQEAARWYEEALKIDPRNVNASTDLGISYYYIESARSRARSSSIGRSRSIRSTRKRCSTSASSARSASRISRARRRRSSGSSTWRRTAPTGAPRDRRSTSLRSAHPNLTAPAPGAGKPPG